MSKGGGYVICLPLSCSCVVWMETSHKSRSEAITAVGMQVVAVFQ